MFGIFFSLKVLAKSFREKMSFIFKKITEKFVRRGSVKKVSPTIDKKKDKTRHKS